MAEKSIRWNCILRDVPKRTYIFLQQFSSNYHSDFLLDGFHRRFYIPIYIIYFSLLFECQHLLRLIWLEIFVLWILRMKTCRYWNDMLKFKEYTVHTPVCNLQSSCIIGRMLKQKYCSVCRLSYSFFIFIRMSIPIKVKPVFNILRYKFFTWKWPSANKPLKIKKIFLSFFPLQKKQ